LAGPPRQDLGGKHRAQEVPPMAKTYTVHARWDEASRTWWTDGEDIPGLTCQGDTFDDLAEAVLEMGPELLHANRVEPPGETVVITVVAERQGTACIAA
jgi:hypothetical protein